LQQRACLTSRQSRHEPVEPLRKLSWLKNSPHQIGFIPATGEKVLTGRFISGWVVAVAEEILLGPAHHKFFQLAIFCCTSIVENLSQRESGIGMLTGSNRLRKQREVSFDSLDDHFFQRAQIRSPLLGFRVVPGLQLNG